MKLIRFPGQEKDGFLRTAIKNEIRLYAALKSLFDLLENYGPVWYTKHHHDKARTALVMHGRTLREGHSDSRKRAA
jgi:hypothetical protein